jgi:hypothetical protein
MTTGRIVSEYYTPDEFTSKNNKTRIIPRQNYSHAVSNNTGVITSKTRNGSYNIIEKDFGDYKVIYHVPIEYGDDYDVSQLEDIPAVEEQRQQTPKLVRRRIYQQYNDIDYDDDYGYIEEIPVVSPRRHVYVSSRRPRDTQVVKTIYETRSRSPTEIIEYVYEDDYEDGYDYKPDNQEQVEYVVRERVPKQTVRLYTHIQLFTILIIFKYLYQSYSLLFFKSISVYGRTPTCTTYSLCRRTPCTSFTTTTTTTTTSSSSSTCPSFTSSFSLSINTSFKCQSKITFTNSSQ